MRAIDGPPSCPIARASSPVDHPYRGPFLLFLTRLILEVLGRRCGYCFGPSRPSGWTRSSSPGGRVGGPTAPATSPGARPTPPAATATSRGRRRRICTARAASQVEQSTERREYIPGG
eukprot:1189405-Prorocentrum_minimum.AAC.2